MFFGWVVEKLVKYYSRGFGECHYLEDHTPLSRNCLITCWGFQFQILKKNIKKNKHFGYFYTVIERELLELRDVLYGSNKVNNPEGKFLKKG